MARNQAETRRRATGLYHGATCQQPATGRQIVADVRIEVLDRDLASSVSSLGAAAIVEVRSTGGRVLSKPDRLNTATLLTSTRRQTDDVMGGFSTEQHESGLLLLFQLPDR